MITPDQADLVKFALTGLKDSDAELDRTLYQYFRNLSASTDNVAKGVDPGRPVDILQHVVVEIDRAKKEDNHLLQKGTVSVSSFFLTYLNEFRKIICGSRKSPTKLGSNTHAIISGLAAFITSKLGVSDPTAVGIAVLVLLTLAQATKNTFCKMTDIDVYKAVRAQVEKQ